MDEVALSRFPSEGRRLHVRSGAFAFDIVELGDSFQIINRQRSNKAVTCLFSVANQPYASELTGLDCAKRFICDAVFFNEKRAFANKDNESAQLTFHTAREICDCSALKDDADERRLSHALQEF
jgi:hypothetical protein